MCFDDDSHPLMPVLHNTRTVGEDTTSTAVHSTSVAGYIASPDHVPEAQVIALPDPGGLHEFYQELAGRFAEMGVTAFAIDYSGRSAENDDRTESFDYIAHIRRMTAETFGLGLDAAVQAIRSDQYEVTPTFILGFCMGGSLAFWLGTRRHGLAGSIGFYGGLTRNLGPVTPAREWAARIENPVLGLFGGADQGIPVEAVHDFDQALEGAHIPHEIVDYPGAQHSFFDPKAAEFTTASADAWNRVQSFIAGAEPVHA